MVSVLEMDLSLRGGVLRIQAQLVRFHLLLE